MKNLSLFLLLAFAPPLYAQVVPPKPAPAPVVAVLKAKVTPTSIKGGEQLVIDASAAKGKVTFKHDFPAGTFAIEGKKLFAALPPKSDAAHKFSVWLTYWDEQTQEELTVTVPGVGPVPVPPDQRDSIAQLRVDMNAGFAALAKDNAGIKDRLTALEAKPVPPPIPVPPKPDPTPTPNTAAKLFILAFYDKTAVPVPDVLGDLAYWESLKGKGHLWRKIDIHNPDAAPWQDYYTRPGASPPTLVFLDAGDMKKLRYLGTAPMPKDTAGVDGWIKTYTGK